MEEEKKSSIVAEQEAAKPFGEYEAGIQEYISPENTAIQCVIKHRFSDFIVNEIDEHGKVQWFVPETDLQKWKKVNIQQTLPQGGPGAETSNIATGEAVEEASGLAIQLEEEKRA